MRARRLTLTQGREAAEEDNTEEERRHVEWRLWLLPVSLFSSRFISKTQVKLISPLNPLLLPGDQNKCMVIIGKDHWCMGGEQDACSALF